MAQMTRDASRTSQSTLAAVGLQAQAARSSGALALAEAAKARARIWPVYDFLTRATCSGVPCATMRPPASPPSGPRSMIQSACLMTSILCSMISTVLPRRDEAVEHVEEFFYVVEVQAGGGLVQDVERAAGLAARKFAREFRALGFAAGKRGGGLAELDVAEADVHERFQLLLNRGNIFQAPSALLRWAGRADRKSNNFCSARRASRRCSACRGRLRR